MKRVLFLCLFLSVALFVSGQEKDFAKAIKDGKKVEHHYVAYPSNLTVDKYKKWITTQRKYVVINYKTENKLIFGFYTDCISEISFIPYTELEEYEKKSAKTLRDMIAVRKKYPDYNLPMTVNAIYDSFIIKCGSGFISSAFRCLDTELINSFLKAFPEYKNNEALMTLCWDGHYTTTKIKSEPFIALFGKEAKEFTKKQILKGNFSRMTLREFIDFYGDYESAKAYAYDHFNNNLHMQARNVITFITVFKEYYKVYEFVVNQMRLDQDTDIYEWARKIIPHLRDHVDVSDVDAFLKQLEAIKRRRRNEIQQERCDNCIIESAKTVFPTSAKHGEIYMKNGRAYKFDMTSKGKFQLLDGFFGIGRPEYDSFSELVSSFEKECIKQYCK